MCFRLAALPRMRAYVFVHIWGELVFNLECGVLTFPFALFRLCDFAVGSSASMYFARTGSGNDLLCSTTNFPTFVYC
jgi:hypothetical protein